MSIANRKHPTARLYDAAVLGETPAGLAAAIALAKAGRRVAVVQTPCPPAECPLADWVPASVFALAPFLKPIARDSTAQPFTAVTFHSDDGGRTAQYAGRQALGYTLAAGKLVAALRSAATKLKVGMVRNDSPIEVRLAEDQVTLAGRAEVSARMLLIACDQPARVISELSLPVRNVPHGRLSAAGLDVTWTAAKLGKHVGKALHVVALGHRGELALFFAAGATLHIRLIHPGFSPTEPGQGLSGLVNRLKDAGLLPADLPLGKIRAATWRPPAGVALELENHVAKRALLIGTAGGFVDLLTAQSIAPGIWSALLAAEAVHAALDAEDPQGTLNGFMTSWRRKLADYLRPPNTAVHLLMPLLFANKQMVTRFARAMLYGECI